MANTNGFEGVPWMIGGGAKHSADVGRVLGYAATGGEDGVIKPGDCKVTATTGTANLQVHVARGAVAVRNLSAAASTDSQTYIGRAIAISDLDVGSTGGSPRSDLVVARVKDPQYSPWQPYAAGSNARANGPYIFPEIIPGVPATTTTAEQLGLSHSMYALARIDIPANTSAITSGMIKDLRELTEARSVTNIDSAALNAPLNAIDLAQNTFKVWPNSGLVVKIPKWATHMTVKVDFTGIGRTNGKAAVAIRAEMGTFFKSSDVYLEFDDTPGSTGRESFMISGEAAIPDTARGTSQTLVTSGARMAIAGFPGHLRASIGGQISWIVSFRQQAV